jgi:hypothetical protein
MATNLLIAVSVGYTTWTIAVIISQLMRSSFRKTQLVKPATTQVVRQRSFSTGRSSKTVSFSDVDMVFTYECEMRSMEERLLLNQQRAARKKAGKANKRTHDNVWDGLKMCTRITDLDYYQLETLEDKSEEFQEQGLEVTRLRHQASEVTKVSSQWIYFYFETRKEGEIFLCNPDDAEQFWKHRMISLCVASGHIRRDSNDSCRGQWLGSLKLGNKVKGFVTK